MEEGGWEVGMGGKVGRWLMRRGRWRIGRGRGEWEGVRGRGGWEGVGVDGKG